MSHGGDAIAFIFGDTILIGSVEGSLEDLQKDLDRVLHHVPVRLTHN